MPKAAFNADAPETKALIESLQHLGFTEKAALEAARQEKTVKAGERLKELPNWGSAFDGTANKSTERNAKLILSLFDKVQALDDASVLFLMRQIKDDKLQSPLQITCAIEYLQSNEAVTDLKAFNEACGVDYSISAEDLLALVTRLAAENLSDLKKETESDLARAWTAFPKLLGAVAKKEEMKWVPSSQTKSTLEILFVNEFGEKPNVEVKKVQETVNKAVKPEVKPMQRHSISACGMDLLPDEFFKGSFFSTLHKPGGNAQIISENMSKHLSVTEGAVWTRFPPEPNGFLHVGHIKAISVDFGYAAHHNGRCYLRYDDTNPAKESGEYFETILESVRWLGFEPWKITYTSDYFQHLYDFAVQLIRDNLAFVCHQTAEEQKIFRGEKSGKERIPSPWRDRPRDESLAEFEKMRRGEYEPGEATLRLKQDLTSGNPHMWDIVIYRVSKAVHHRTGDKWKIYPMYDFAHCLCDSLENISHSLCTPEFILQRETYDWICNALKVYRPQQSEYGRMAITGNVTSKRKIIRLVNEGFVSGWDDPRLFTLVAQRRRGIPPGALLSFIGSLGVTDHNSVIPYGYFEQCVRDYLEMSAPRLHLILKPLKLIIDNLPEDHLELQERVFHPKVPEMGKAVDIPLTREVWIDQSDFEVTTDPDYYRLTPTQPTQLLNTPHQIHYASHQTDDEGTITEVHVNIHIPQSGEKVKKSKGFIQWIADCPTRQSPVTIKEVRIYSSLFKSDEPDQFEDFTSDVNPHSLTIVHGALIEPAFFTLAPRLRDQAKQDIEARQKVGKPEMNEHAYENEKHAPTPSLDPKQLLGNECVRFQGVRVGYFALDKDGSLEKTNVVLNRIVTLKEDSLLQERTKVLNKAVS